MSTVQAVAGGLVEGWYQEAPCATLEQIVKDGRVEPAME